MFDSNWDNSSLFYFFISVLFSVFLSLFFYGFLSKKKEGVSAFYFRVRWVLLLLRALSLIIAFFLLLGPVFKYVTERYLEPQCLILVDDSHSIAYEGYEKSQLISSVDHLASSIAEQGFGVKKYLFDRALKPLDSITLKGETTDFEQAINRVKLQLEMSHIKELVVVTDGRFNSGSKNQSYSSLGVPISFVALGDTGAKSDLEVRSFFINEEVYKGDRFSIKVGAFANKLSGKEVELQVKLADSVLFRKTFPIQRARQFWEWELFYSSDTAGVLPFEVIGRVVNDQEKVTKNNVRSRLVNVKEKRKTVLIVYRQIHPDVKALKRLLSENKSYQLITRTFDAFLSQQVTDVDLIVQFGAPKHSGKKWEEYLSQKSVSRLVFAQSVPSSTAEKQPFLFSIANSNEVGLVFNQDFDWFNLDSLNFGKLTELPPLNAAGVGFSLAENLVLAKQSIAGVKTERPLISIREGKVREVFVLAENWWRWDLRSKSEGINGFNVYGYLMKKLLQYGLAGGRSELLWLTSPQKVNVDEPINVSGRLYDLAGQESADGQIEGVLFKDGAEVFRGNFLSVNDQYLMRIPGMAQGVYTLKCAAELAGRRAEKSILIGVQENDIEAAELGANVSLMRSIAAETEGVFTFFGSEEKVVEALGQKKYESKVFFNYISEELIHFKLFFFFLLFSLLLEWFLRKLYGSV